MLRSVLLVVFLVLSPAAPAAHAATFMAADQLSLSAPIGNDLYAAGATVRIEQPVAGDLLAAGGNVAVRAKVNGDVIIGAGNVSLDAQVGDDVRVGGGDVAINSAVAGDVIVMGGTVSIGKAAVIGGDVIAAGGDIVIMGTVNGKLWARGGTITQEGIVRGEADVQAEQVNIFGSIGTSALLVGQTIALGNDTAFGGPVRYWRQQGEMDFGSTLKGGPATYDATLRSIEKEPAKAAGAILGIFTVFMLLSSALLMLIAILATRTFFPDAANHVRKQPLWMLLWGFLFLIATPVLALVCMATLIGIPLGLFILVSYAFLLYFCWALTALVFGKLVQTHFKWGQGRFLFFILSIAVYIVLGVFSLIPVLGWLVQLVAICTALGALWIAKLHRYRKEM